MCGIVGYIGKKNALPILIEGLTRLEYRGYDSAGVALVRDNDLFFKKQAGKVADLEKLINKDGVRGTVGIAHTRWATHGEPNEVNAHPHFDCSKRIALVHNGIIENHKELRRYLEEKEHRFISATDTEVVAHLIEEFLKDDPKNFLKAFTKALRGIKGSYAFAVLDTWNPDAIYAVHLSSPLVLGLGENENFLASDASPFVGKTNKVIYLDEDQVAVVRDSGVELFDLEHQPQDITVSGLELTLENIQKGNFPHFMLKEIYEQPETIFNAMRGRLLPKEGNAKLGGLERIKDKLLAANRFIISACGTSWHSALVGEYMFEELARVPTEVEYASEFRYRNPIIGGDDVFIAISQSGETADTLAALREAKKRGATSLGIVNVVGSTIAREAGVGVYIHAGPEIGVASTKAFTSQLTVLALIALMLARENNLSPKTGETIVKELINLPDKVRQVLSIEAEKIKNLAGLFKDAEHFLFLGRGANFPTALEGALKMKEISYIHAEGYAAAEMKHGPIALIDQNMPVVFIAPQDGTYEKILSNIEEVRARKGVVIAIANNDDKEIEQHAEFVIRVPRTLGFLGPIVNIVPLQLLAYYIALERGCSIDQPRNLAKSVTVE